MLNNLRTLLVLFVAVVATNFALSLGSPPSSDFSVAPGTVVPTGTTICYTDLSDDNGEAITNWDWTFGTAAANYNATTAGTANPPCVTYNTAGTFNTCLTVTNADDNDQLCQTITVTPEYNIGIEDGNTITGCGSLVTDDGGFSGNYGNNQNNSTTFCSGSTDLISLVMQSIDLAAGDVITIYEGTGTGGTVATTYTSADNGTSPTIIIINTCITIELVTDGSVTAAGFSAVVNCVPDNYYVISGFDGQTITDCGSGVTFWDPGGPSANYGNNENYTITFCAANATDVVQILFQSFQLGSGDQLNVYDGSTTGGSLIYTADNSDNGNNGFITPGLTITGVSQCMTFEFISDGSGTSSGWEGDISCETPPAPCNANPIAADNFDAATMICDFSQYCGITSSFYGVDMGNIGQSSEFNGSLENNSWLMFTADATTASFTVATASASCYIQIGIYAVDANENFTWLSPESINGGFDYTNVDDGFAGTGTLNAQGMTPGETYYIMIDGHGGSVCDYTLTAGIGVQLPEPLAAGPVTMCVGDIELASVSDNNGSTNVDWEWTWNNGAGGPMQGSSIDLSTFAAGTYTFDVVAEDYTECVSAVLQDQVTIIIDPCVVLPVELVNFQVNCDDNYRLVSWQTASEINNDYFILERAGKNLIFEEVETINGVGNSNSLNNYSVMDFDRSENLFYYRLKQVDFDGTEKYSNVISSSICNNSNLMIQNVYYDNSSDEIVVKYTVSSAMEVNLKLTNLTGDISLNETLILQEFENEVRLDASNLASTTIYIMTLETAQTVDTKKILIIR